MDFNNRGPAPQQPIHQNSQFGANPQPNIKRATHKTKKPLHIWGTTLMGAIIIALIVAVIAVIGFEAPKSQGGYVYTNKLQAVFLNTGQVYFGNIKTINPQFLVLVNIFYLQTSSNSSSTSTSAKNNVSLVKLGCELHAPYDQMVINMSQVTFWENLQSTGQVAKAVAQYYKTYPNGQTCNNSKLGSAPTSSSVQSSSPSSSSSTTPSSSSATTKKP